MSFDDVWLKIKEVTGLKTFVDLATAVKVQQSAVSKRRKRGVFPAEWILILADQYGFSSDWAWSGKGDRRRGEYQGGDPGGDGLKIIAQDNNHRTKPGALDHEMLLAAVTQVENSMAKTNRTVAPDVKAQLIVFTYDLFTEEGADKTLVNKLVEAGSINKDIEE